MNDLDVVLDSTKKYERSGGITIVTCDETAEVTDQVVNELCCVLYDGYIPKPQTIQELETCKHIRQLPIRHLDAG